MRVLYVAHRINAVDGSAVHCRAFVEHVRRLGHEVETFPRLKTAAGSAEGQGDSLWKRVRNGLGKLSHKKVVYFFERFLQRENEAVLAVDGIMDSLLETIQMMRIVRRFRPDVIVYRYATFRFAPSWISAMYGIPLVAEVNHLRTVEAQFFNKDEVGAFTRVVEKKAINGFGYKFCVSERMKYFIEKYCGTSEITIVPNGVDHRRFDIRLYSKESVKRELGLSGKTVLGYVGSYQPWHGVDIALRVMELLAAHDENYHLLLVGSGLAYSDIQLEIRRKGLESCVTQVGKVPHEEIPQYMACFDYALMSYPEIKDFHGSPLKMFEYMSMSIPVVATSIGQLGEILTHGQTGYLVSPPTPENFVHVILDSGSQEVRPETVGRNARKLVEEQYSWLANARSVMRLCERAVNGAAAPLS